MKNTNFHNELITTFNFKCLNRECPNNGLITIQTERKNRDEAFYCPNCNSSLKLLGERFDGVATFGSKTPEQKKEILKQRAKIHNQIKMKDRIKELKRRIIKNNFNADK